MKKKQDRRNILFVANGGNYTGGYVIRIVSEIKTIRRSNVQPILLYFLNIKNIVRNPLRTHKFIQYLDSNIENLIVIPSIPFAKNFFIFKFSLWLMTIITMAIAKIYRIYRIHAEGYIAAIIAIRYKELTKTGFVFDIHGVYPEEIVLNWKESKWKRDFYEWACSVEKCAIKKADHLIFVSNGMKHFFLEKYSNSEINNSTIVPCCVDYEFYNFNNSDRDEIKKKLCTDNNIVYAYMGSIDSWQCFDEVCSIFKGISTLEKDSTLLVLTNNRKLANQIMLEQNVDLSKVRLLSLTHDQVGLFLQAADLGFLIRKNHIVNLVSSPTKLSEYLAAGLPIITTEFAGDSYSIVKDTGIGIKIELGEINYTNDLNLIINFAHIVKNNRNQYAKMCNHIAKNILAWSNYRQVILDCYDLEDK